MRSRAGSIAYRRPSTLDRACSIPCSPSPNGARGGPPSAGCAMRSAISAIASATSSDGRINHQRRFERERRGSVGSDIGDEVYRSRGLTRGNAAVEVFRPMELSTRYTPADFEKKVYEDWIGSGGFTPGPAKHGEKTFTIM